MSKTEIISGLDLKLVASIGGGKRGVRSWVKQISQFMIPLFLILLRYAGCVDKHRMCPYWAMEKECELNPDYMHESCKKSCKLCVPEGKNNTVDTCVDKHIYCAKWARRGECALDPNYMNQNCCQSCSGKIYIFVFFLNE